MKGNILLGQARGKLGDIVFSRANGQQVARARAQKVKNPQSEAQMIQRIILNTVAQAYSKMSAITDHSFEGIPSGQQSMSYFMRKNMDALRQSIAQTLANGDTFSEVEAFSPLNSNLLVPNVYIIAKGTLPEVVPTIPTSTTIGVSITANTYQGIIDTLGLQRGDQLTFVVMTGSNQAPISFKYARVILDPTESDGTAAPLSSTLVVGNAFNVPSSRNEGDLATVTYQDGLLSIGFDAQPVLAAAVIVSRKKQDGTWMRSNASFILGSSVTGFFPSLQQALDLFAAGGIETLSELYLNNAGQTTQVSASSDSGSGGDGDTPPVSGDGD